MKKLINATDTVLAESLDGFAAVHADLVALGEERNSCAARTLKPGKVALISGGGSGHEPLHAGFVGQGMLDAACPGQVFTSPTPDQMLAAAEAVDTGAGVLFIVKNYEGDVMNFEMAAEMAPARRSASSSTTTWPWKNRPGQPDGAASRDAGRREDRGRGGGGGARRSPTCRRSASEVNARTRSMGVALTSCTVPAAGKPTFILAEDEMEMGVGIHGEPGRTPRQARLGRRHRGGDAGGDHRRPGRKARRRGSAAGERLWAVRRRWSSTSWPMPPAACWEAAAH